MNANGTRQSYSGEPKATRVDRAAARVEQLKKEMATARLRKQEAEAQQGKINRLMERKRVFAERQVLGQLCRIAGLNNHQRIAKAEENEVTLELDQDLIAGALLQLAGLLKQNEAETNEELRQKGKSLLWRYAQDAKRKGVQS